MLVEDLSNLELGTIWRIETYFGVCTLTHNIWGAVVHIGAVLQQNIDKDWDGNLIFPLA